MNRNQWFVFGIGSMILSGYLFFEASTLGLCSSYSGELMTSCFVRRYGFAVPAIIFTFVGWFFIICGFLESKKK